MSLDSNLEHLAVDYSMSCDKLVQGKDEDAEKRCSGLQLYIPSGQLCGGLEGMF